MIGSVSIYLRRGTFWVCVNSTTVDGFLVGDGFEAVEDSASDVALGEAVLRARGAAREGVPNPPRTGPSPFLAVLQAAGTKSWAQFVKGTRVVEVEFEADCVNVVPLRRDGAGWSDWREATVVVDDVDAGRLGAAVREALGTGQ